MNYKTKQISIIKERNENWIDMKNEKIANMRKTLELLEEKFAIQVFSIYGL